MPKILRLLTLAFLVCGGMAAAAAPAEARTHHKKHHVTHHTRHHIKAKKGGREMVRTAQNHLANLGYYRAQVDGISGPKTIAAIKHFQRDHHLRVTGKLTTQTYNALVKADTKLLEPFPESLNVPVQPPMGLLPGSETPMPHAYAVPSRFAKIEVSEEVQGPFKRYVTTINGQPFLAAEGQPSVIGISNTYDLGNEEAIIFSTYRQGDITCSYRHFLLTLRAEGNSAQEIGNCTRGYQANVVNNTLIMVFPESDDGRAVGSTWRYDNGDLERL